MILDIDFIIDGPTGVVLKARANGYRFGNRASEERETGPWPGQVSDTPII